MSAEQWRDVPGFPGYRVSDCGRVRGPRRMLRPDRGNRGHLRVRLYRQGRGHMRWIHRLVLEAFVGPKPPGAFFGLHANDDRDDNRVANLSWGSRADNARDARRNGRAVRGRRVGTAKLTPAIVRVMRQRYPTTSAAALGAEFGVSRAAASAAIRGATWGHVS